jgi:ketosteroid isomerase-like protein
MFRAGVAALGLAAVLAVGGCGGEEKPKSDEAQIKAEITSYYKAFSDGDGNGACNHLTKDTRAEFEKQSRGRDCGKVFEDALKRPEYKKLAKKFADAKVSGVKVDGKNAIATVSFPGVKAADGKSTVSLSVPLEQEGGEWKIARPLGG